MMRVLNLSKEARLKYPAFPAEVPMKLFTEEMARDNHGQSLARLNERGGLSVKEMVCNIRKYPLSKIGTLDECGCVRYITSLLNQQP